MRGKLGKADSTDLNLPKPQTHKCAEKFTQILDKIHQDVYVEILSPGGWCWETHHEFHPVQKHKCGQIMKLASQWYISTVSWHTNLEIWKQACKPQSYVSAKLWLKNWPSSVKCRATSVAKNGLGGLIRDSKTTSVSLLVSEIRAICKLYPDDEAPVEKILWILVFGTNTMNY